MGGGHFLSLIGGKGNGGQLVSFSSNLSCQKET